ncbi:MAG: phosphodiesterase, partial [Arthrobacter sp.]|nr:phosphodiesterase [Arthrobacter sp.]
DSGQSFNLVHVYEHTIVHSVVPMGRSTTVGEYVSPEETKRRLDAAGVRIPESAKQRSSPKLGLPSSR